jgi:hypothetical protein
VLENPLQNLKEKAAWWFGTWLLFFHMLGIIIPTDFNSIIFQRGRSTTNQKTFSAINLQLVPGFSSGDTGGYPKFSPLGRSMGCPTAGRSRVSSWSAGSLPSDPS